MNENFPSNKALYNNIKREAKNKFKVYPSVYAKLLVIKGV